MGFLFCISIFFAIMLWLFVPDPGSIDASKFSAISSFLKVFLAFLLGFFMASSVGRWTTTVKGFLGLFNAVRNMAMQMYALGVDNDKIDHVVRYGIVSCVFLVSELEMAVDPPPIRQAKAEMMWHHLKQRDLLSEEEGTILEPLADRASLIWIWVASKIGRLSQDGDIPPMNSGTYGRIMALCQSAQDGIRQVRSSLSVQIPFIYTHMLACLVHLNNLLCILTFGLTLGSAMGAILAHYGIHSPVVAYLYPHQSGSTTGDVSSSGQSIVLSMFTCLVAPFMYQAFLQIALALAQPFGSEEAAIPTDALIMKLRADLDHMERMSDNTPGWEKPVFKS
jgi:predicted membrane chloride channel (bestrophin family)